MFEKGESAKKLANDYGIGFQTVRDIKKNKEKLMEFTRNCQFYDWCDEWREQREEEIRYVEREDTRVRHATTLQCVGILLDYVEQWDFN